MQHTTILQELLVIESELIARLTQTGMDEQDALWLISHYANLVELSEEEQRVRQYLE